MISDYGLLGYDSAIWYIRLDEWGVGVQVPLRLRILTSLYHPLVVFCLICLPSLFAVFLFCSLSSVPSYDQFFLSMLLPDTWHNVSGRMCGTRRSPTWTCSYLLDCTVCRGADRDINPANEFLNSSSTLCHSPLAPRELVSLHPLSRIIFTELSAGFNVH
jgi:hypothetical protein